MVLRPRDDTTKPRGESDAWSEASSAAEPSAGDAVTPVASRLTVILVGEENQATPMRLDVGRQARGLIDCSLQSGVSDPPACGLRRGRTTPVPPMQATQPP